MSIGVASIGVSGALSPTGASVELFGLQMAKVAALAADEKTATDTVVLEVGEVLGIAEAFVITSAGNARLVRTIAEEVEHQIKEAGGPGPLRVEGRSDARWILMDYGDIVVHVFLEEARSYYDLERLWADAPRFNWQK